MGAAGLAISFGLSAISNISQGITQKNAIRSQARAETQILESNARLDRLAATDAIERGEKAVRAIRSRTKQTLGAQRVALAGQGVDVNSGSGIQLQIETDLFGKLDEIELRNNARMEAFGFKARANQSLQQSRFKAIGSKFGERSTLLTSGFNTVKDGLSFASAIRQVGG